MVRRRSFALIGLGLAVLLLTAADGPRALEAVASDIYIVPEDEVVSGNLYVSASVVSVHGTVEGDLIVLATGRLRVTGSVKGDVVGFARTASIEGSVEGSIRLVGVDLDVSGRVGDEVAALARRAAVSGSVRNDALIWASSLLLEGDLGRDLGGRTFLTTIDGSVGGNVEMTVDRLRVGPGASVAGDLGYRSAGQADIDPGASVGGTLVRRSPLSHDIWFGAVRLLVGVMAFLLFLAVGLLAIRLRPSWLDTCTTFLRRHPAGTIVRGLAALVVLTLPVTVPVVAIWVGSPGAVMAAAIVGLVCLVPAFLVLLSAVITGLVPVIVWAAGLVTGGRIGPYGSFLSAALLIAILLLIPYASGVVGLALTVLALGVAFRDLPRRRTGQGTAADGGAL